MSGRHPSSPSNNNRDDGRRRKNHPRPTSLSSMNGGGGGRHHDAPPHRQQQNQHQQQQRQSTNEQQPPPYSRYTNHNSTLESRWREPSSSSPHVPQQQQSTHPSSPTSTNKRGTSFAEKRRLQERREFDKSFSTPSNTIVTNAAGITSTYNDDTTRLGRQNSGGSQGSSSGGGQISNEYLKDILSTAVAPSTVPAAATTTNTADNGITSTNSTEGAREGGGGVGKTSITLANYSSSGKRLDNNSSQQRFVVDNRNSGSGNVGGYSNLAAASSSAPPPAGNMKPSSILKRSSSKPSSILKNTSYSSQVAQPNQQQQQQQQSHNNTQNKVDWGDNSTREIESRLSPVMMVASVNNNNSNVFASNTAAVGGGGGGGGVGNNNFNRRNSNESHPNNNNLPPPNHPNNFTRRGSGGAHPQSPSSNNNSFTRRNSGGSTGTRPNMGFNAPCRLEEHKGLHKWKDCPNNPHSDNYNGIHFKTASHQQLLESVQVERQQQFQRKQQQQLQQQQRQQQQTMNTMQGQEANRSRGMQHPPSVVAASSLKRPAAASKPNPTSAVAAARRSSEASNLFNTTKSARTTAHQHSLKPSAAAAGGGSGSNPRSPTIPKKAVIPHETQKLRDLKQTTEMHSSTMHIPRKPQQQLQQKKTKVVPRKQHQSNVEFKNGRFQRRTSNNFAPSGQDAVPIAKQTSGRLVTKAKKPPAPMRREDASRVVVHRGNNGNVGGMDDDTDESHHTLMDDEIMELDDFGTTDLVDGNDGSGEKEKASLAAPLNSSGSSLSLKITRDPGKNGGSVNRKKKKKAGNDDDSGEKEKASPAIPSNSNCLSLKIARDLGKRKKKKKADDEDGSGEKEKASPSIPSNSNGLSLKIARDPGKNGASASRKKMKKMGDGNDEKNDKKQRDDGDDKKNDKKKKEDDDHGKKQKPVVDMSAEKKKKKSKKKCRKPGCDMKRSKGNKFCKTHVAASKKSDAVSASEIDILPAKSAKPAALKEAENVPKKKVKAKKKHGLKRKSPPEPSLDVSSLNNGNDVPFAGTASANKRQALESHRSSENQNHSDQLMNDEDEILPDLDDGEVGEMETDLFNLLDETIKIRYQGYIEEHKIDEDLLFEEEQAPLDIRTEDTSPPDESSLAKDLTSPNEVGTGDKENMSSALLNSLTDSASMDTGDDSEDDDQIPLFYTCEKCDRVFFAKSQVADHENQCTKEILDGRVFTNPNDIAEYYEKYQTGGILKPDCVIFYRPPLATPYDNSGRTISPEDFEGRGGNRNDVPQNLLDDFMSSKSPNATSAIEKKNAETDFKINPDNTRHACMVMNAIERLSSTVINPNSGLPSQTITTFCSETETLYDFRVEIKPSNIPNSGLGAFVTFLGARVLKKSASDRSARLVVQHVADDVCGNLSVKTHEELTAEMYGGRKMHVTLKGDNLHHNDNSLYWSNERQNHLKRHIDKYGTLLDHFDEDEVCCKVNSEVKKFRSKIPEAERIGFLGIHSESDYVEDKTLVFTSEKNGLGMLELGRYGPHRKTDVKDNLHFGFKSFIFNAEPSEWSYGVSEQRLGRDQAIDITDDTTGEIHSLARQCTPVYVNEVGHNKKLHCNVDIRHTNECSVYYYIFIDKDHAMKAGDQVELLVDYGEAYEDVRERKGYGKDNNKLCGGDDDDAARLKRNFVDREMVQQDIPDLKLFDMFYLVEYLTNDVLAPIDQRIRGSFSANGQAESFTRLSKDIVARQRIHWLRMQLQCRLKEMMSNPNQDDELLLHAMTRGRKEMVTAIDESLLKWDFDMLPDILSFLNTVSNGDGKSLQDIIRLELSEELLYSVGSKLPDPLNSTMWCKISIDLANSITWDIARYLVCCKDPEHSMAQMLAEQILVNAKNAASKVREACHILNTGSSSFSRNAAIDELSFHSLRRKMKKKDVAPNGSFINVYGNDLNIHHGTAATIADIQAYQDAVELGYLEPYFDPCSTSRLADSKLTIVSQYASLNHNNGSQQFHWMARSIDAFDSGVARVNEQWYLLNQILLPVHILASECVEWKTWAGSQFYSLEKLCKAIGIKLQDAEETIKRGVMRPELEEKPDNGTNTKKKKRLRGGLSNAARTLENRPCEEFPGWTVERIQRKNSHHVDSYWSHPGLAGVVLRSRVGVKEMIAKMETNLIDANTAYNILISEGKKKFFGGRKSLA